MNTSRKPSPARWLDIPALFLLLLLLTTAFTRLIVTRWAADLDIVRPITYLGLIAGVALGYSRFSPRRVAFFAFIYGMFVVAYQSGVILGVGIAWQERLLSLAGRLGVIISFLVQQKPVPDNLLFLVLMGLLFWFISLHGAYSLTRYAHPWASVLPAGLTVILIQNYDPSDTRRLGYLVFYLFCALIFVVRAIFIQRRRRWEQTHTYMPPYLGADFLRVAATLCIVLLALAWTVPALADALPQARQGWDTVVAPWWNDLRNVFDNAFASLRSTVGIPGDYFGPNLSLGRGNSLSDSPVFYVATPPEIPSNYRFYWRARVYENYNNGWNTSLQSTRALDPEEIDLTFPDMEDNAPDAYAFTFNLASSLVTLPAPQQVIWVSRPTRAELALNPDGSADLGSLRAIPSLRAGETYSVQTSFNNVTIADMRRSGSDYPEWVTARYLALPTSITQRTRQLAAQLAEGLDNPYDITAAVTDYLRQNYEYQEVMPGLPPDQDLVDWFLFDYPQGFCNYYATAEIVLLRAAGVPARLAVGYAQGVRQQTTANTYLVRQRDAHAWPEVYFNRIGWVEFEPTVSQPALVRPSGESLDNLDPNDPLNSLNNRDDPDFTPPENLPPEDIEIGGGTVVTPVTLAIIAVLSLVLLALLVAMALNRRKLRRQWQELPMNLESSFRRFGLKPPAFLRRWAHLSRLTPLQRAYQEINAALQRLGKPPVPALTAAERAQTLAAILPPAQPPAALVLDKYQAASFSPRPPEDTSAASQAGREIRRLSWLAYLQKRLAAFQEGPKQRR
ncbi:MAG: transglutaminase-like domain-containing protein [Chloroflexi bacterium]|nr:transglutaminase-like domain-containing protein [Chloroflexota bacterium]